MVNRSLPAVAALVLVLVVPATAQVIDLDILTQPPELPENQLPTPAEIIARHIEATGGRAAHERVHNRKLVGTLRQGDQPPQRLVIHQSAPNNRHVELIGPGGAVRRFVVNEDESWTYEGDLVVASGGDQRTQEIRRGAFRPLLEWAKTYELAKTLGIEDVAGRPAYKLQLTADDCHKVVLFFDRETGRAVRRVEEIAYAGTTIATDMTIDEYRIVDGLALPVKSRRALVFDGRRVVQEYVFESVDHDVEMPAALFETPPELQP